MTTTIGASTRSSNWRHCPSKPAGGRQFVGTPLRARQFLPGSRLVQLHPLVVPQDSQTKHEPAGRIRTPQVEQ
jgi:hypothetical protein